MCVCARVVMFDTWSTFPLMHLGLQISHELKQRAVGKRLPNTGIERLVPGFLLKVEMREDKV